MTHDQIVNMLVQALNNVKHCEDIGTAHAVARTAIEQWTNCLTPATINMQLRATYGDASRNDKPLKVAVVKRYRELTGASLKDSVDFYNAGTWQTE